MSFGVASHGNNGGVAAAFAAQAGTTQRRTRTRSAPATGRARDFVRMNKLAVKNGLVTVKDAARSRDFLQAEAAAMASRAKTAAASANVTAGAPLELGLEAPSGGAFGKASDPPEVMSTIFSHEYGKQFYAE